MTPVRIATIVEGHGEVEAVPILIRRHADSLGWHGAVHCLPPIRQSASKLLRAGELERAVELASRKLGGPGGILVLMDCEDQCPATLGPALLHRVRSARGDLPSALVLAHREFEAWFIASAESLAGKRGLPPHLRAHPAPETIRGCKEWLTDQMRPGRCYDELSDQPAMTNLFDLGVALRASPSFDKCHRELASLLKHTARITPGFQIPGGFEPDNASPS